jgi:1,4-dihydroxy-2-naphthoyl-CoA synthase
MSSASYETLIYEKSEGGAVITLNRPEVLNAVNEKMGQELLHALRTADHDPDIHCYDSWQRSSLLRWGRHSTSARSI